MVNPKWDIALVKLTPQGQADWDQWSMADQTECLTLKTTIVDDGSKVVSCGFPLGLEMHCTKGIIGGTQVVFDQVSYAHDADINPGNSGGVLCLDASDEGMGKDDTDRLNECIGINFASMDGAKAMNYAIPAYRAQIMLNEYDWHQTQSTGEYSVAKCGDLSTDPQDCEWQPAPAHLSTRGATQYDYDTTGCAADVGVYVTQVPPTSLFAFADPPIEPDVLLTHVEHPCPTCGGPVALDRTGIGIDSSFFNG